MTTCAVCHKPECKYPVREEPLTETMGRRFAATHYFDPSAVAPPPKLEVAIHRAFKAVEGLTPTTPTQATYEGRLNAYESDLLQRKAEWRRSLILWGVAAFSAAFALALLFGGCASLSAFATAHPDVVQKAETAVELAQCVDTAVVKYKRAEVASTATAVTTLPPPTPEGTP